MKMNYFCLDFDDLEWRNYEGMVHRQSQLKNFRDFFLRANKYPCLSLGSSDATQDKKIILVEVLYVYIKQIIVQYIWKVGVLLAALDCEI